MACRSISPAVVVSSCLLVALGCAPGEEKQPDPVSLVPDGRDLGGWIRVSEPETYVGEELFQLINGGAEMYHEFGFVQVHAAEFELAEGRSISFELFEMTDSAAAFGVFSFKRGSGGRDLDITSGCVVQDYYLNMWSGPYVLTLTGMSDDAETATGLERIAGSTAKLIGAVPDQLPAVAERLESLEHRSAEVRYLRGDLALANSWLSGGAPRFFFDEGAVTAIGEHQVLVLAYGSAEASRHHLELAVDDFIGNDRFLLREEEPAISMLVDHEGWAIQMVTEGRYIVVVSGPEESSGRSVLENVVSLFGF